MAHLSWDWANRIINSFIHSFCKACFMCMLDRMSRLVHFRWCKMFYKANCYKEHSCSGNMHFNYVYLVPFSRRHHSSLLIFFACLCIIYDNWWRAHISNYKIRKLPPKNVLFTWHMEMDMLNWFIHWKGSGHKMFGKWSF